MKIQISVWEVVAGLIIGAWFGWVFTVLTLPDSKTSESLIEKASCPENVFQEKTIVTPDGGTFTCGAIRMLPVDKRELQKWYKEEARLLLKRGKKK